MRTLTIAPRCPSGVAAARAGTFAGPTDAADVFATDVRLRKSDGGTLAVLVKGAISHAAGHAMWQAVRDRIEPTENRGVSTGQKRIFSKKKDGTTSRTNRVQNAVQSAIMGYYDRYPRFPYCRQTAFQINHPAAFAACMPALREAEATFARFCPEEHARQKAVAASTHADFVIAGTTFTTVTLNRNFRTAYHCDAGDLPEGFGVMSCYRAGKYTGGELVFPRWGVGFAMDSRDVILFDPHELHGNTAIRPLSRDWERITCVHYYREGMRYCGSAAQELELAARHDARTQQRTMRATPQERP